ncbi:hypothetical protein OBBRIDRAFT_700213, partial [Obba rivulosa]
HRMLGHLSMKSVKMLHTKGMVRGMLVDTSREPSEQCEICVQAKHHQEPFPKESQTKYSKVGE